MLVNADGSRPAGAVRPHHDRPGRYGRITTGRGGTAASRPAGAVRPHHDRPGRYGRITTGRGGTAASRPAGAVRPHHDRPRRPVISSRTRAASAWPLVAFITAPTRASAAAVFPARTLAATSGYAAMAASTAASSVASSLTTARPRAAITSFGPSFL